MRTVCAFERKFALRLERLQELDDGFLVGHFQFFKLLDDVGSLAAVPRDGFEKRQGGTVMHQSRTQTNSPQRSGANLVSAALKILFREIAGHLLKDPVPVVLASGLQDSVAGTHVVHQEISIGVQREGSERGWNRKRSAVDFCSCRSGDQCLEVAS